MHSTISNSRVAVYVRVATEQQADGFVTRQLDELRQRIAEDGGSVGDEACFVDQGASGVSLTRPALQRLREKAARGDLDRLYVLAPDRLARSPDALSQLTDEFTDAGVELIYLDPPTNEPT